MKRLENLILKSCSFTVLIVIIFFLFTFVTNFTEAAINIGTFMLIFLFGAIVATANIILDIRALKFIYRLSIHYVSLLIAFLVVFVFAGKISTGGSSAIFSAVVIFTFLYTVVFLISYFIKRSITSADKKIDKRHPKKITEKKQYNSLYK